MAKPEEIKKEVIVKAYRENFGSKKKTAEALGISQNCLFEYFKKYPEIKDSFWINSGNGGEKKVGISYPDVDHCHFNVTPEERDKWHSKDFY